MRRFTVSMLVVLAAGSATSRAQNLDSADRAMVASRIYALVQQYFAHWDGATREDVDSAYRTYVGDIGRADTRKSFDLATLRFIASLHNGHSQFIDSQADGRPLKFRLLDVEGQWVVLGSLDSRLTRGSVVRSIDGKPVAEFVKEASQYVAASNERLAQTHVFSYPILFGEKVSIGLQNGSVVVIDRAAPPDVRLPQNPSVEGRWLREGEVAYVRVSSFGDPNNERQAVDLIRQFAAATSLIVDVRGNGGGSTPGQLIGALMDRPWRPWLQVGKENAVQTPAADAYKGRVIVLADRFCGSACEDFVMPFKTTKRGTLVGELTQGSSGNPFRADLGHGISVAIGAVHYRFPDDSVFEGVGIAPDVPVERRIADLVANRDVAMTRAVELAGDGRDIPGLPVYDTPFSFIRRERQP